MKKFITALALLLSTPLALRAEVTQEDLRKLCAAGISDATILTYARANPPLPSLTAADLVDLRRAGASDALLSSLLDLAKGTGVPARNAPAPAAASDVYITPASDPSTVFFDSYDPGETFVSAPASYCFPSFGLGLDLCGGLYSGCTYGTRCYRSYGSTSGPYNYHGYGDHDARPHPAPTYGGRPFAGPPRGLGSYRGGPPPGQIRGSHPSAGTFHSFSGSSHGGGSHFGGGGHSSGGGGHSSGGHGGHR